MKNIIDKIKSKVTKTESEGTSDIDGGPTLVTIYWFFKYMPFWMTSELD